MAYLDELDADLWDAQIERDAAAGKLDLLINEVRADVQAGRTDSFDRIAAADWRRMGNGIDQICEKTQSSDGTSSVPPLF